MFLPSKFWAVPFKSEHSRMNANLVTLVGCQSQQSPTVTDFTPLRLVGVSRSCLHLHSAFSAFDFPSLPQISLAQIECCGSKSETSPLAVRRICLLPMDHSECPSHWKPIVSLFSKSCVISILSLDWQKAIFEFRGYVKAEVTFRAPRREQNVICLRRWGETAIFRQSRFIYTEIITEIAIWIGNLFLSDYFKV